MSELFGPLGNTSDFWRFAEKYFSSLSWYTLHPILGDVSFNKWFPKKLIICYQFFISICFSFVFCKEYSELRNIPSQGHQGHCLAYDLGSYVLRLAPREHNLRLAPREHNFRWGITIPPKGERNSRWWNQKEWFEIFGRKLHQKLNIGRQKKWCKTGGEKTDKKGQKTWFQIYVVKSFTWSKSRLSAQTAWYTGALPRFL